MAKLTITVDDNAIENFILNMLNLFKNNPEVDFKKDGNDYIISTQNAEQNLMLPGEPMSWEKLVSDIEQSEWDYEHGNFATSKELLNEVKSW